MSDVFKDLKSGLQSPATHLYEVTPSDSVDLPQTSRALNVGGSGVVRVTTKDGDVASVTIAAGVAFPVRVTRIWATGTTATGIVLMC